VRLREVIADRHRSAYLTTDALPTYGALLRGQHLARKDMGHYPHSGERGGDSQPPRGKAKSRVETFLVSRAKDAEQIATAQ